MDFSKYYGSNITYINQVDDRLNKIIKTVLKINPNNILDVGCGNGHLINQLIQNGYKGKISGVDVYTMKNIKTYSYKKADITKGLPFEKEKYDMVILGEVIEHVPNTDYLLREIYRVLIPNGTLIISTPNLVCWFNRIIVPLGIQPLFTETSNEKKFGRIWHVLGQNGKSEGHLKIFTSRSLKEILEYTKFNIKERQGVLFFFPFPLSVLDRIFVNFVPLASGLLYVAQKNI